MIGLATGDKLARLLITKVKVQSKRNGFGENNVTVFVLAF